MARRTITKIDLDPHRLMYGKVVREEGVKKAISAQAELVGMRSRSILDAHRYDGNAKIEVDHSMPGDKYGHIDSFVVLVDEDHVGRDGKPDRGDALAIEFGRRHNFTGKYIPGIHPLYRGAGLA